MTINLVNLSGLTNTVTAVKNAQMAESPVLLLGGAAATLLKVCVIMTTHFNNYCFCSLSLRNLCIFTGSWSFARY